MTYVKTFESKDLLQLRDQINKDLVENESEQVIFSNIIYKIYNAHDTTSNEEITVYTAMIIYEDDIRVR